MLKEDNLFVEFSVSLYFITDSGKTKFHYDKFFNDQVCSLQLSLFSLRYLSGSEFGSIQNLEVYPAKSEICNSKNLDKSDKYFVVIFSIIDRFFWKFR